MRQHGITPEKTTVNVLLHFLWLLVVSTLPSPELENYSLLAAHDYDSAYFLLASVAGGWKPSPSAA
jgi:hypothetical protein